jgi:hypothetical protein
MFNTRLVYCAVAVGLACSAVWAAKQPPAPVPPGKIIFVADSNYYEMNGDGSGKQIIASNPQFLSQPRVSVRTYGTDKHRWWIGQFQNPQTLEEDIYAFDGSEYIQLTSGGAVDNGDGTSTVNHFWNTPAWSNDGRDSFFSVAGNRYLLDNDTGAKSQVQQMIWRVDVSALDLELYGQAAIVPIRDGDPNVTAVVTTPPDTRPAYLAQEWHCWSADSTKVAYVALFGDITTGKDLWVADVSAADVNGPVNALVATRIFGSNTTASMHAAQWTPPGAAEERIALIADALYTLRPDGTGLTKLATTGVGIDSVFWSPDAKALSFRYVTTRPFKYIYDIARIPAAGGSSVNLTSDMSSSIGKGNLGWSY